jgi:hypothetical protein
MNRDERRRAAYHESGHAVASVSRGGYVKYIDLSRAEEELQETCTDDKCANKAFMIWAGPWAQARWDGDCTVDRIMAIFQTQSFWDWPDYEERFGRDVRDWATAADLAKTLGRPMPEDPPPVTPPDPGWDAELTEAWPEIEQLANSLLDREPTIDLSNGQRLVQERQDYWRDPNPPTVEEECTSHNR